MAQSRQTILVVDDTPENIDALDGVLEDEYQVTRADSGAQALQLAAAEPAPDLILLDLMMPEMDGYEVCRRLKAHSRTRGIPVIFVTSVHETGAEAQGFAVGAVDYLTKPISAPIVRARVRTHLALHDQNRELERQVRERTMELGETRLQVIRCLGKAAEYKDDITGTHVIRMSHYSRLLALHAGMSEEKADLLLHAAPMHDVGKIGIPDRILQKPGRLDAEEWAIMKTHAAIGAEIIGDSPSLLLQLARTVAISHHERWDGSGYPKGIRGTDIPLVGRIVAIADVFDALTSVRPYKPAWPVEDAIAEIRRSAGSHLDPQLVDIFIAILPQILEVRARYLDPATASAQTQLPTWKTPGAIAA